MSLSEKKVEAEGPLNADIYFVGESPGRNEARKGRPFVGRSGKELENLCTKVGIGFSTPDRGTKERSLSVRVNNACKYYPTGKKKKWFFRSGDPKDGNADPTERFIEGISELLEDIDRVQPNVVMAMGNYALWALTQEWGIQSWRGSILESTLIDGLKVIPTLHPAFIQRMYTRRPLLIWDLKRVKEESKSAEIVRPRRDYTIFPNQHQIDVGVERLLEGEWFTFDTEWFSPTELACIGFTNSENWAICIPASAVGAPAAYDALLSSDLIKIAQNAFFDVTYLREQGYEVKTRTDAGELILGDVDEILRHGASSRLVEDTMVAHHVCWPEIQNRLERLASIYTKEPYYKDEFKVWQETRDVQKMFTYNCKDVAVTHECHLALQREREYCDTDRAYELNMLTLDIMARATKKGIRADHERLMALRQENKAQADELQGLLDDILGWQVNPRSWKDVKRLVYGQLGFRERKRKPTAQETLMDIAAQSDDEFAQAILKTIIHIRRYRNWNSRYIHPCAIDTDGRIRCSWNMAGTVNGRLSASKDRFKDCPGPGGFKGRGLPLQTIPYKAREFFIPDKGHVFIMPDLEQAEARIVAYLSEDYRVLDWLDAGLDIHSKLAELLFDADYDEIVREKKETGESHRRYLAKTCRHALNYKMGPRTFKGTVNEDWIDTGVGVTESEAKTLRSKYLNIHSPLKAWWGDVQRELSQNQRKLTNPVGRTRRFLQRWGDPLFRDAIAFVPQSTIGDLTHLGLYSVDQALPYADVLVNIHDGSVIQVPEAKVDEAVEVVMECLDIPISVNGHDVRIPIEVKVGYNWKEGEIVAST